MAHIPGFDKGTGEHQTISFESVCAPGHYTRQKNYKFVLGKKGETKFGKLTFILIAKGTVLIVGRSTYKSTKTSKHYAPVLTG